MGSLCALVVLWFVFGPSSSSSRPSQPSSSSACTSYRRRSKLTTPSEPRASILALAWSDCLGLGHLLDPFLRHEVCEGSPRFPRRRNCRPRYHPPWRPRVLPQQGLHRHGCQGGASVKR